MRKQLSIKYYILLAFLLSIGMTGYWLLNGEPLSAGIEIAAAILLAALPLPLWLGQHLPLARGMSKARQSAIELTAPPVLAAVSQIDTLIVTKDGILTEGRPYIAALIPEGISQSALLALAASAEREAVHPIGQAIYQAAIERSLRLQPLAAFNEIRGCGIEALINRSPLRVGQPNWLQDEGVEISAELLTRADQLSLRGQLPIFVANGPYCRGIIAIDDEIPANTIHTLHQLQRQSLRIVLLTSANKRLANALRKQTGIDDARAGLSSDGKAREIQLLKAHRAAIAMISHDAGDEAALAEADLTIQLGQTAATTGESVQDSDQSQSAAIVLKSGQLHDLSVLLDISRQAMHIRQQNRLIAGIAWLMLLPPAMGILHAFGGPFLPMAGALAGQVLAVLLILANSLRT